MITIYNRSGTPITGTGVLQDLPITKDSQHVEEMMKDDYVVLSWKDAWRYRLSVGYYIIPFPNEVNPYDENDSRYPIKYRLFQNYDPEGKTETLFEYDPHFQHPIMWLSYLPFILITGDVSTFAKALKKTSWGYTGSPGHIAGYIVDCINWWAENDEQFNDTIGGSWIAVYDSDLPASATVNFESVDIFSAAGLIAQAFDCEFHFDFARREFRLGAVRYGTNVTLKSGDNVGVASVNRTKAEFHNAFLVKGSTRNLSQPTDTGENAQVRERLTLDPTTYPDSVIYTNDTGNIITKAQFDATGAPVLMKELVFDGIYPKLDLYLYNIRERKCYLLDEFDQKVPDELDPTGYKTYSKWYCRLAYPLYNSSGTLTGWQDYLNPTIIDGQHLQMTFLPNTESGAYTSLMIGQGDFDMVYFSQQTHEQGKDDIDENGFTAYAGDYRIEYKEGTPIIPTTSNGGIYPQPLATVQPQPSLLNNKATLINIVVSDDFKTIAQSELEKTARRKVRQERSDLNNYIVSTNPVEFESNPISLHVGQSVTYSDGADLVGGAPYQLNTHIIKIVTSLDKPFVKEITVGNEKVKSNISTIKEDVDNVIANIGNGSSLSDQQLEQLLKLYGGRLFLSKKNDDTAKGFITFLKGLQVGERFVSGLLGEGGVFRREEDGTTYIEADKLYIRMKAYFDTVEIRDYRHSSGNRIASPAGMKCIRVVWFDASGNPLEQISANLSSAVKFRCFFRARDGENEVRNNFVVGDQAYCHITTVETAQDSTDAKGLNMRHYWRLVIGKSSSPDTNGEHWIDLSNVYNSDINTIGGIKYAGFQADSDVPQEQDDIVQLGNVNDATRRGAIIEFVTGADSPSYQIFQGIGDIAGATSLSTKRTRQFSTSDRNYINLGYATGASSLHGAGHAFLEVMGDFYFGAKPASGETVGNTYIKYDSDNQQLDIKANVTFTSPTTHQDTTIEDFAGAVTQSIEDLQEQIDGEIDTWFYEGTPTLNNAPANGWTTDTEKERHLGDLYYDIGTGATGGFAYRFIKTESGGTTTYSWQYIDDTAITEALREASLAYDLADHKRRVFLTTPTPPYDNGDLWVNAVWPASGADQGSTYNNDILRCQTSKTASQQFAIADWTLASKYTDDSALVDFVTNTYAQDLENIETQIDGKAETWYQDSDPSTAWTDTDTKVAHVGDIWYDTSANGGKKTYIWRDRGEGQSNRFYWAEQAVPDDVFDEIDGKAAIYVTWNAWVVDGVSQLNVKDLFIPSADVTPTGSSVTYYANKVYRCTNASTPTFQEIRYTDDSKFDGYINQILNGSGASGDSATVANALRVIKGALNEGTEVDGGLVLTSLIGLRSSSRVWAGISGQYQATETGTGYKGHGIAAWFGGAMVDKEVTTSATDFAKTLFRFDGSGYVAGTNISWDAGGNVTIQGYQIKVGQYDVATTNDLSNFVTTNTDQTITGLKTFNSKIKIGDIYIGQDSNGNLEVYKLNGSTHVAANLYATGAVSAFGIGTSGGGGTVSLCAPLDNINNNILQLPASNLDGVTFVWNKATSKFVYSSASGAKLSVYGGITAGAASSINGNLSVTGNVEVNGGGFVKSDLPNGNNYVLLAGGSTKLLSEIGGGSVNSITLGQGGTNYTPDASGIITLPPYPSGTITSVSYNNGTPITPVSGTVSLGSLCVKVKLGNTDYTVSSAGVISLPAYPSKTSDLTNDSGFITGYTDTKNTAGSTNKVNTKMFFVAATSQAANPQTYSNSSCYIGTDNCLYSGGSKVATGTIPSKTSDLTNDSGFITGYTDTKNTAGTTNKVNTKMFLVGATSQGNNPQTYSNSNCYIGTDNCLYSGGNKVLTSVGNVVTSIALNGSTYSPQSGVVTLPAYPSKTSQLTNDSGFITGESTAFTRRYYYSLAAGKGVRIFCGATYGALVFGRSTSGTTSRIILMGTGYSTTAGSGRNHWVCVNRGGYVTWTNASTTARCVEIMNTNSSGTLELYVISPMSTVTFTEIAALSGDAVTDTLGTVSQVIAALPAYLPLSAGAGNALTDNLYFSNTNYSYGLLVNDGQGTTNRIFAQIAYGNESDTGFETATMTMASDATISMNWVTANAEGYQRLKLGNSTKLNAAGNRYGTIRLYGKRSTSSPSSTVRYVDIVPAVISSSSKTLTLPNKNGTVAVTADLDDYLPLSGGTMTGALLSGDAISCKQLTITTASGLTGGAVIQTGLTLGQTSFNPSYVLLVDGNCRVNNLSIGSETTVQSLSCATLETHSSRGIYVKTGSSPNYIDGSWVNASDIRLKDIVSNVGASIEQIANAPVFNFRWKAGGTQVMLGTSAQHWHNVFKFGVSEGPNTYLFMDYGATALAAAVITARKVVKHEDEIAELKRRVKELEDELKQLKAA